MSGEITNPFPNFNGTAIEDREWMINSTTHFTGHTVTYYTHERKKIEIMQQLR